MLRPWHHSEFHLDRPFGLRPVIVVACSKALLKWMKPSWPVSARTCPMREAGLSKARGYRCKDSCCWHLRPRHQSFRCQHLPSTPGNKLRVFIRDNVKVGTVESVWYGLKWTHKRFDHNIGIKHLQLYVNEFWERHNSHPFDPLNQTAMIAEGVDGKRLKHLELTKCVLQSRI